MRLTAGLWNSQNTMSFTGRGNHTGALGGFEWTAKTFRNGGSIVPTYDWQSGNGYNGYSSFGVMLYPTKKLMILPAYDVGNDAVKRGNHFAALFVGYMF